MSKDFLEHRAFVELFDLHYGNLVGFVYGYVRDEEVAKERADTLEMIQSQIMILF